MNGDYNMLIKHKSGAWNYFLEFAPFTNGTQYPNFKFFSGKTRKADYSGWSAAEVLNNIASGMWIVATQEEFESKRATIDRVSVGDKVTVKGEYETDIALVSQVGIGKIMLISLEDGNRWSDEVYQAQDVENIGLSELATFLGLKLTKCIDN